MLIILMIFIFYIENRNTGLVLMLSIILIGSSMFSSLWTICTGITSQLNADKLDTIKRFLYTNGHQENNELLRGRVVLQIDQEGFDYSKALNFILLTILRYILIMY